MADKILKELTLKIWRQKDAKSKGGFETYKIHDKNRWLSITTVAKVSVEPVVYSSMDVHTDRMMT